MKQSDKIRKIASGLDKQALEILKLPVPPVFLKRLTGLLSEQTGSDWTEDRTAQGLSDYLINEFIPTLSRGKRLTTDKIIDGIVNSETALN